MLLEFWMVFISRLQALRHFDANIALVFICVINSLFTLFLYCYFGSLATDSFSRISDCVYDSRWYELPTELKIYPIMILGNSHLPLRFYGHKIISINLETYKKVRSEMWKINQIIFIFFVSVQILKTVSSFYLMFRALVKWNRVRSTDNFFYLKMISAHWHLYRTTQAATSHKNVHENITKMNPEFVKFIHLPK